jgi:hypothetical protein
MVQSSANYSMSNLPSSHKFRRDACRMIFKILEGCDRAGKLKFLRRGILRSAASRNVETRNNTSVAKETEARGFLPSRHFLDGTVALHLPHGICSGMDFLTLPAFATNFRSPFPVLPDFILANLLHIIGSRGNVIRGDQRSRPQRNARLGILWWRHRDYAVSRFRRIGSCDRHWNCCGHRRNCGRLWFR